MSSSEGLYTDFAASFLIFTYIEYLSGDCMYCSLVYACSLDRLGQSRKATSALNL